MVLIQKRETAQEVYCSLFALFNLLDECKVGEFDKCDIRVLLITNSSLLATQSSNEPHRRLSGTLFFNTRIAKGNFSWYSVPGEFMEFNLFNSSTTQLYNKKGRTASKATKIEWKIRVKRVVARQSTNRAKWRWENMPRIYGKSNLKWKLYALRVSFCGLHHAHKTLFSVFPHNKAKEEKKENLCKPTPEPIDKKGRTAERRGHEKWKKSWEN